MSSNYAVIDIGTLKVKFYIASTSTAGKLTEKYKSNTLTCFGVEMDQNEGCVKEEYIRRTIKELARCKALLKKHKVKKFRVVSTHAMRRAKNKQNILERIKKELGVDVENISQEMEAELFFQAVMRDFPEKQYAVLDIGGGSVQVLIGKPKDLNKMHLMQTGASYLHGNFTKNAQSPKSFTTLKDIERMKDYILKQLMPIGRHRNIPIIYGSSNIIDLMKAIGLPLDPHEDSTTHPYKTYAKYLEKFIHQVLPHSYYKREKLYEFQKGYMWGVDKAFLNVVTIAEHLKSPYIIPSNANIAQGFIYSMVGK